MPCGTNGAVCSKQISISLNGGAVEIILLQGRNVTMNGNEILVPYDTATLQIYRHGTMTVVMSKTSDYEFTVEWDGGKISIIQNNQFCLSCCRALLENLHF